MSFYIERSAVSLNQKSNPKKRLPVAIALALGVIASPQVFASDAAIKVYGRAHVSFDRSH